MDKIDIKGDSLHHAEVAEDVGEGPPPSKVRQLNAAMYEEALDKYGKDGSIDPAKEKQLKRKLDAIILTCLGVCYFFYYVDKTTLSYAAIFGIKDDLHLKGTQYSWLSSIFYFGWLVWAIPSNLIMQRSPPGYYLAFNIFMWGALLMCQAASKSFATLAVLRILSGAFEAIADPAFLLITMMFYTREEQPWRIACWYSFNGVGVAGGGLIGYGIGHITTGGLASWRYEFLIVGAFCSFWGLCLFYLLPNSPTTFRFFSHDERLILIARLRKNQTGVENRVIKKDQVLEFLTDWKSYLYFSLGLFANIPNGGISNFSTLVIKGLGFNTFQTALLGIPQGALVVFYITSAAFINSRMGANNSRLFVAILYMIPTIAGALGFLLAPEKAYIGRLICFYLTGSYQGSFIIGLSTLTSNTAGQTKKSLMSAIIWAGACVGNIAGPFFYKTSQAPKYRLGIGSILVANCVEVGIFVVFRILLQRENKKKKAALEAMGPVSEEERNAMAFSDLTDIQNPFFEYVY